MPRIESEVAHSAVAYIQHQNEHHRNGSLRLEAEPDEEDPTDLE
jgi:hypothetical protein